LEEQQTHPQKNTRHFAISAGAASSMRQVISKAVQQAGSHEMVKNYAGSHCKEQFFWVNYNDLTVLPHWNHG